MAQFYEMPAISPTMELGTLVQWRLKEGQPFESSAVVAEVATDKANMDAEIFDAGVMLKHLVAEGDEIPPGYPIAIVGRAGDDIAALLAEFEQRKAARGGATPAPAAATPTPTPASTPTPQPAPAPAPAAAPASTPAPASTTPRGDARREWMGTEIHTLFADPPGDIRFGGAATSGPADNGRVAATPLARKVAADLGIDLHRVSGTGPAGRITRADVEQAPRQAPAAGTVAATRPDETVRNSPMRKTIAKRLLESHLGIPTFFLTVELDGQGMVDLREDLRAKLPDLKVSVNDLLVMAVARALREHPEVNASWGDKEIVRHGRVDIGVAVAIKDGLITPVLRGADRRTLTEIATTTRELAKKARDGKLQPDEYTGGTFTISNLGMMDIQQFTAIINPPESAILAVGALEQVPVVVDGQLDVGWRMRATMTCDHRVIDGAVGAAFLQTVRKFVEAPWLLLV